MKVTRATTQESLFFHDESNKLTGSCLVSITGNEARISGLHGKGIYLALVKEVPHIFERHNLKYIKFVLEKWHAEKLKRIKLNGYKVEIDSQAFSFDGTFLFWATVSRNQTSV